jgi:multidrug transporter EmrE-like cation transporter
MSPLSCGNVSSRFNNKLIFVYFIMFLENIQMSRWLMFSSFFSALTIIIIKQYEKTANNWLLLVTTLSETGLIYSYIKLLKNDDILTQFALVKIIAIIMIIAPSILLFGSEVTMRQIIGLIFAIVAIYLLK